jgi:hypothetical protein
VIVALLLRRWAWEVGDDHRVVARRAARIAGGVARGAPVASGRGALVIVALLSRR